MEKESLQCKDSQQHASYKRKRAKGTAFVSVLFRQPNASEQSSESGGQSQDTNETDTCEDR